MTIHLEPTWSFEFLCYLVMDMIFLLWNKFKSVVVCFMIKCEYESMGNRFVWCINGTGTRRLWPLLSSCIWSLYLGCFTWRHCSCCLFSEIGDCDNHLWKKKPYVWFFIWWVRHLVGPQFLLVSWTMFLQLMRNLSSQLYYLWCPESVYLGD